MAYLYELLTHQTFQQLCQTVLAKAFPGTQCYPVGQADGGRDGSNWSESIVYQVKWTQYPDRVDDPVTWLLGALEGEREKILRLRRNGLNTYYLLTNVSGTAPYHSGEMDGLKRRLRDTTWLNGISIECWWRDTIDAHVNSSKETQWAYPQMLTGAQAVRLVIESLNGADAERRSRAIKSFLSLQYVEEYRLRFKQVGLEGIEITDLFVDVPAVASFPGYIESSTAWHEMTRDAQQIVDDDTAASYEMRRRRAYPAAELLTSRTPVTRVIIYGGPGQGKSTLLQYISQLLRARLLDRDVEKFSESCRLGAQRLPIKVDLKEFAAWRRRRSSEATSTSRGLEQFLAERISATAGGQTFSVDDLYTVLTGAPSLIALDGLDEIAIPNERSEAVEAISQAGERFAQTCPDVMIVVTSRPEVDSDVATLPESVYLNLTLSALSRRSADRYARKWTAVQPINLQEQEEILTSWSQRRDDRHVRELSRNPMQLSILLHLIKGKGASLPDRRTLLYDDYIKLLLEREGEKDRRVANYREVLLEVHGYIAFYLHGAAEQSGAVGEIDQHTLRELIREHLGRQGRDSGVNDLFAGVQRVVALVQNKNGRYEFEVQPLREYFAGRYLYNSAPYVLAGSTRLGQKHHRLYALLARPYWANVLRFFAGCFAPGELSGLVDLVRESELELGLGISAVSRRLARTLVSDQLFSDKPTIERRATQYALDAMGRRLVDRAEPNDLSMTGAAGFTEAVDLRKRRDKPAWRRR